MKIKIPATSANLGCGYDTLGVALSLYNSFDVTASDEDVLVGDDREVAKHMVFGTKNLALEMLGLPMKNMKLQVESVIPESRGLGSSATCILAGVMAALFLNGRPLDEGVILRTATRIEGHPDNIVAAYKGGLTASLDTEAGVIYKKFNTSSDLIFLTVIPPFEFSTAGARAALPAMIRHRDATANLGRVILLADALENGKTQHMKELFRDELHEKYRLPLIRDLDPQYGTIWDYCQEHSRGVYLSGAGPSFMAVVQPSDADILKADLEKMAPRYQILKLRANNWGTETSRD